MNNLVKPRARTVFQESTSLFQVAKPCESIFAISARSTLGNVGCRESGHAQSCQSTESGTWLGKKVRVTTWMPYRDLKKDRTSIFVSRPERVR